MFIYNSRLTVDRTWVMNDASRLNGVRFFDI